MSKKGLSIRDMCYMALFTALIIVLSQLPPIPMPMGVPMTLQTFIIPLTGVVLGAKRGFFSVLTYCLLGAVGLPVFVGSSGFVGGLGILFGVTGGFIFGFPFYALFAGLGAAQGGHVRLICGLLIGMVITYLLGMVQFSLVTGMNLHATSIAVVWPFLPTEMVKLVLVFILGPRIRRRLEKSGLLT